MPELSLTNKKFVATLAAVLIVLLGGVALAIGKHDDKPAKTQGTVHTQNTAKKQDTSAASVLGASTDTSSDTSSTASDQVTAYTPPTNKPPVVVGASSESSTPATTVPAVSNPADSNSANQTGGMGAGDQSGNQNQGDQTGDNEPGDQNDQPGDDQNDNQGDGQTDGSDLTDSTPAPQPGFHLTFHPESAYELPLHLYPEQVLPAGYTLYAIPFDIVYDEGFVQDPLQGPWSSSSGWPGCQFLVTPTTDYNVRCDFSQRQDVLVVETDDTSAVGHYEVETTYSLNGQKQVNTVEFDIEQLSDPS